MALADSIKLVAQKIQEATRHLAPVLYEDAAELAEKLLDQHGINKVATVEGLKAVAAAELKSLADGAIDSGVEKVASDLTKKPVAPVVPPVVPPKSDLNPDGTKTDTPGPKTEGAESAKTEGQGQTVASPDETK